MTFDRKYGKLGIYERTQSKSKRVLAHSDVPHSERDCCSDSHERENDKKVNQTRDI